MKRLAGKVAVITGAGRPGGLGAAIARRLAEDGARIVISDIGQVVDEATPLEMIGAAEDIAQVAAELKACGAEVSAHACDVRQAKQVDALAEHAVARFGAIDIWVNNAGIGYIMKPLVEVSAEDWAGERRAHYQHRKPGGQVRVPFCTGLLRLQARPCGPCTVGSY